MGVGGISIWQLLIILVIVLVLFGTKRLRNLGGDLGSAIKGFKKAMKDESPEALGQSEDLKANKVTSTTNTSDPNAEKTPAEPGAQTNHQKRDEKS